MSRIMSCGELGYKLARPQTRRQRAALLPSAADADEFEEEISRVTTQTGFSADTVRRGLVRR